MKLSQTGPPPGLSRLATIGLLRPTDGTLPHRIEVKQRGQSHALGDLRFRQPRPAYYP